MYKEVKHKTIIDYNSKIVYNLVNYKLLNNKLLNHKLLKLAGGIQMFIGREQELNTLNRLYSYDRFEFAVIYRCV